MSNERIQQGNNDLYNKIKAALGQSGAKVELVKVPTNFGLFGGNKVVQGDVKEALLSFANNQDVNLTSTFDKPVTNQINADGSGTKVITTTNEDGSVTTEVQTLGPGGKLLSKKAQKKDKNGKLLATKDVNYTYDKDGNLKKTKSTLKTNNETTVKEETYNKNGKVAKQTAQTTTKSGNKILKSNSKKEYEYNSDGSLKTVTAKGKDKTGKPFSSETEYENNKMSSFHSKSYVRGALVETFTDSSSAAGLPSKKITYGPDGKTPQEVIENSFDSDGILCAQKITDASGNVITHDYSKVDGNFEIGNQQSRGDCYLLATINALRETSQGHEMLQKTVTESVDENGKKVYTITFPGAKSARESLINGEDSKIGALPADKVHIQESYTITEDELKEALKQQGKKYSVGDRDVVLLELGFEKYRQDVKQTVIDNHIDANKTKFVAGVSIASSGLTSDDALSGGQPADAMFILTGIKSENQYLRNGTPPTCYINSDMSMTVCNDGSTSVVAASAKSGSVVEDGGMTKNVDTLLDKLEQDCKDGKLDDYAATACFMVSSQEVNGQVIEGGGHALTITKVTADTVEMTNPWDPAKTVTMSREDFKRSTMNMNILPLNGKPDTKPTQEHTDENTTGNTNNLISQIQQHIQNNTETNTPNYTVPEGKGYTTMIKEALIQQGIPNPTPEQIARAKEQFVAANPDGTVLTYHGKNKANHGNQYLLANAEVYIPKFEV